jgi:hypothetical protein
MERRKYTSVKASDEYWQHQLVNNILAESDSKIIKIYGDEITFENVKDSPSRDILHFSKKNPDQTFKVKCTQENRYENLVTVYQIRNGEEIFLIQYYDYYFGVNAKMRDLLPPGLWERFQTQATAFYTMVDNYRIRTSEQELSFQDAPVTLFYYDPESIIIPTFEQIRGNVKLTAKKFGLTYLDVKIEFLSKRELDDNKIDTGYPDLPF